MFDDTAVKVVSLSKGLLKLSGAIFCGCGSVIKGLPWVLEGRK